MTPAREPAGDSLDTHPEIPARLRTPPRREKAGNVLYSIDAVGRSRNVLPFRDISRKQVDAADNSLSVIRFVKGGEAGYVTSFAA